MKYTPEFTAICAAMMRWIYWRRSVSDFAGVK